MISLFKSQSPKAIFAMLISALLPWSVHAAIPRRVNRSARFQAKASSKSLPTISNKHVLYKNRFSVIDSVAYPSSVEKTLEFELRKSARISAQDAITVNGGLPAYRTSYSFVSTTTNVERFQVQSPMGIRACIEIREAKVKEILMSGMTLIHIGPCILSDGSKGKEATANIFAYGRK